MPRTQNEVTPPSLFVLSTNSTADTLGEGMQNHVGNDTTIEHKVNIEHRTNNVQTANAVVTVKAKWIRTIGTTCTNDPQPKIIRRTQRALGPSFPPRMNRVDDQVTMTGEKQGSSFRHLRTLDREANNQEQEKQEQQEKEQQQTTKQETVKKTTAKTIRKTEKVSQRYSKQTGHRRAFCDRTSYDTTYSLQSSREDASLGATTSSVCTSKLVNNTNVTTGCVGTSEALGFGDSRTGLPKKPLPQEDWQVRFRLGEPYHGTPIMNVAMTGRKRTEPEHEAYIQEIKRQNTIMKENAMYLRMEDMDNMKKATTAAGGGHRYTVQNACRGTMLGQTNATAGAEPMLSTRKDESVFEFKRFETPPEECFPLMPLLPEHQGGDMNYFGGSDGEGRYIYYDPLFTAMVGTKIAMPVLADSGAIYKCSSVMSTSQLNLILREEPNAILAQSDENNHIEMKAAASTTLKVTNTVKLRMTVANQDKESGTMTRRTLEVSVMVVPNLSRPFILSNKDLSSFDSYAIEQTTGHLTFRNYRQGGKRAGKLDREHGTLVDDLRIPLCEEAKRIVDERQPILKVQEKLSSEIMTTETLYLKPKSRVFYQVPIHNANLEIRKEDEEDEKALEAQMKRYNVRSQRPQKGRRGDQAGSFARPLVMKIDHNLKQSEHDQYLVTAVDPTSTWAPGLGDLPMDDVDPTKPHTQDTLINAEAPHVLMLSNLTDEVMRIPAHTTIAYIQRIEDTYAADEIGCVAVDLGEIIKEEALFFLQQKEIATVQTTEETKEDHRNGAECKPWGQSELDEQYKNKGRPQERGAECKPWGQSELDEQYENNNRRRRSGRGTDD